MTKLDLNRTLWISGLLTGSLLIAYLCISREELKPQQKKMRRVIDELEKTASEFGSKVLKAYQDQLETTRNASHDGIKKAVTVKEATESVKD
jgi:SepF-like predicted cell division protein (DUF552 family)